MTSDEQRSRMRVQIWSQNYDPEPQGVAPITTAVAKGLSTLGLDVSVIAAHPHYPNPDWGSRVRPYRELRDGIPVWRLPIWPGRASGLQRIRQDLSATAISNLVAPFLPPADALIAVSPSLPGLSAPMLYSRLRRVPWILWLQDIVTDGAATTGELAENSPALRAARAFEGRAYSSANRIIAISKAFESRLVQQGVPASKIDLIYNPMTRSPSSASAAKTRWNGAPKVLVMGNIGRTQGLGPIVDAFQSNEDLARLGAELVITGTGVAFDEVRARIETDRISMPGVVDSETLNQLLAEAHLGVVSQKAGLQEFNLPSKLMNYMAFGIPVVAAVDAGSETARIVTDSGAGWVTNPESPGSFADRTARALEDLEELERASTAGINFAVENFEAINVSRSIREILLRATGSE